jgi:hypothetical protein
MSPHEESSKITIMLRARGFAAAGGALIAPVLLAGVIGAFVTLRARERDPVFELRQGQSPPSERRELEQALRGTDEPVPQGRKARGVAARCQSGGTHSRWSCAVRYASGRTITYTIVVRPSGSFRGESRDGHAVVSGKLIR